MRDSTSAGRRTTILIGLALALGVSSLAAALRLPLRINLLGLPHGLVEELFWWGLTALVLVYVRVVERRSFASIGWRKPDWKTLAAGVGAGLFALISISLAVSL